MTSPYANAHEICKRPQRELLFELGKLHPMDRAENKIVKAMDYLAEHITEYKHVPIHLYSLSALFRWMCRMDRTEHTYYTWLDEKTSTAELVQNWLERKGETKKRRDPHEELYEIIDALLSCTYIADNFPLKKKIIKLLGVKLGETRCPLQGVCESWKFGGEDDDPEQSFPTPRSILSSVIEDIDLDRRWGVLVKK